MYEVGPVEGEFADTAVESLDRLLSTMGHALLIPDETKGHWDADRLYHPHPDDCGPGADEPAVR